MIDRPLWQGDGSVLVVDDEDHVRSILALMLQAAGLRVATARDGLEALELVERSAQGTFDLVVMDMTMPRMDGSRAFREIRRSHPDMPVILTSGYCEGDVLDKTGLEEAIYLQKPFELSELIASVRSILEPA